MSRGFCIDHCADSTVHSVHTVHSDHSVHNASTGQNLHVHVIQKQQQRGFPISFYFLNKVRRGTDLKGRVETNRRD